MNTWIALLRGVNVGGKHIVPMNELKRVLETGGFEQVKTYIQSGNVVFQGQMRPEGRINELIEQNFGFRPEVFIMNREELYEAAANNPYQPDQGKMVHFFFFDKDPESVDYGLLNALRAGSEEYKLVGRVFYLHAPEGIGRSKLVEKLAKAFPRVNMTARNLNTINKLLEMSA